MWIYTHTHTSVVYTNFVRKQTCITCIRVCFLTILKQHRLTRYAAYISLLASADLRRFYRLRTLAKQYVQGTLARVTRFVRNSTVFQLVIRVNKYSARIFDCSPSNSSSVPVTVVKEVPARRYFYNLRSALSTKRTIPDPEIALCR